MKFTLAHDATNGWWHLEFWDGEYLLAPAFEFNGDWDACISWLTRLAGMT